MKTEYLEYFVDFAETQSVAATASHFYLSTQGMNRALHQLEKESGHVLVESDAGSLRLTQAGTLFAEHARRVVDEQHEMQRAMRAFSGETAASNDAAVKVIATPAFARYFMPVLDLQAPDCFDFDVLFREASLSSCVDTLATLDPPHTMGLVSFPCVEKYESLVNDDTRRGLTFEPLAKSNVVTLVSTSSRFAQQDAFHVPADLSQVKCGYLMDEMLLDYIDDYVRDESLLTVTSNLSILEDQVATDRIVTFMVRVYLAIQKLPRGIKALPCPEAPEVVFGFLSTDSALEDPDLGTLRASIRATLKSCEDTPRFRGSYTCI